MTPKRIVHCWKDRKEAAIEAHGWGSPEHLAAEERNGTCMLLDEHEGPHEFTNDDEIGVRFT